MRQGTKLIPQWDPIAKSDSAAGNNFSDIQNIRQVTTGASDPYISSMLRVLLSKVQAGIYRGHLTFIGVHLADDKSGIRLEWSALSNLILFIFKDFACWKQRFPRGTTGGVNSATFSRVWLKGFEALQASGLC